MIGQIALFPCVNTIVFVIVTVGIYKYYEYCIFSNALYAGQWAE